MELHLQSLSLQNLMQQALDKGLDHLRELGVELVETVSPELGAWLFAFPDARNEATFREHPVFAQEECSDEVRLLSVLLTAICPSAFFLKSNKFIHAIYTLCELGRTKGVCPEFCYGLGCYSLCIWSDHRHHPEVYALARASLMLLDGFSDSARAMYGRVHCAATGVSNAWGKHLHECVRLLEVAVEEAMALGDLEWGPYLILYHTDVLGASNLPVSATQAKLAHWRSVLSKKKNVVVMRHIELYENWVGILDGTQPMLEDAAPPEIDMSMTHASECNFRGQLWLLAQNPRVALTHYEKAAPVMPALAATPANIPFHFWYALSALACCYEGITLVRSSASAPLEIRKPDGFDASSVTTWLEKAESLLERMRVWADLMPANFAHKVALVEAECIRAKLTTSRVGMESVDIAASLYDSALDAAETNSFDFEAAFTAELAGRFFASLGRNHIATMYFRKALQLWNQNGVQWKVKELTNKFGPGAAGGEMHMVQHRHKHLSVPGSFTGVGTTKTTKRLRPSGESSNSERSCLESTTITPVVHSTDSSDPGTSRDPSTISDVQAPVVLTTSSSPSVSTESDLALDSANVGSGLDTLSILKATQSFSVEKDQRKLVKRLMAIVLESAAATRGALVLKDQKHDAWVVQLLGVVDAPEQETSTPRQFSQPPTAGAGASVESSVHTASDTRSGQLDSASATPGGTNSSRTTFEDPSAGGSNFPIRLQLGGARSALADALPLSVMSYVIESMQSVCLPVTDPTGEPFGPWAQDPYFQSHAPKACLCLPVLQVCQEQRNGSRE